MKNIFRFSASRYPYAFVAIVIRLIPSGYRERTTPYDHAVAFAAACVLANKTFPNIELNSWLLVVYCQSSLMLPSLWYFIQLNHWGIAKHRYQARTVCPQIIIDRCRSSSIRCYSSLCHHNLSSDGLVPIGVGLGTRCVSQHSNNCGLWESFLIHLRFSISETQQPCKDSWRRLSDKLDLNVDPSRQPPLSQTSNIVWIQSAISKSPSSYLSHETDNKQYTRRWG